MNGGKAKVLRRKVFGDDAQRDRKYGIINVRHYKVAVDEKKKESFVKRGFKFVSEIVDNLKKDWMCFSTGTLVADSQRRQYQDVKKMFKRVPRPLRFEFK